VIEMKDVCKICKENARGKTPLSIAMFSIHSCPVGELGTKDTGGMNVYIRELAGQLGDRGHCVDIYTRVHDPEDSQVIHLNDNARVIHLKAGNNGHMHDSQSLLAFGPGRTMGPGSLECAPYDDVPHPWRG
jgi:hypothetical protein